MEPEIKNLTNPVLEQVAEVAPEKKNPWPGRLLKLFAAFFIFALIVGGLLGFFVVKPGYEAYQSAMETVAVTKQLKDVVKEQDITKILAGISTVRESLNKTESKVAVFEWTKNLPYAGPYYQDARHGINAGKAGLDAAEIAVKAVEPYQDLLGLKGKGTFTGGTIENRITMAVATLEKLTPQIDQISEKVKIINAEVSEIDQNRYPQEVKGIKVREQILTAKQIIAEGTLFLDQAKPLVKVLPKYLGVPSEAKYMILFQNDAELRPTGGFLTAYAIFRIEKGQVHIDTAGDIYDLDKSVTKQVTAPTAIQKYLNEKVWYLRNTNFSPDFQESMNNFMTLYNSSSQKKKLDGIIAMDTNVLLKMIEVIGPVTAAGMTFKTDKVATCDCPQVIYELEKFADEPKAYLREGRKDIIGVLLQEMFKKTMSAPKQYWGPIFQVAFSQMQEKHILVYLLEKEPENGVIALGAGGKILPYDGDYLHINDANLGGAKSNLYITQSVKQAVTVNKDSVETTLTIDYKHPRRADNCSLERKEGLCLSGIYRDYLRVYLPKNAQILETRGFENKSTTFTDLDKTVVDGFFTVVPLGLAKIEIKYKVPITFTGNYKLLIQKQPGTDANQYKVTVNGKDYSFALKQDKELVVAL